MLAEKVFSITQNAEPAIVIRMDLLVKLAMFMESVRVEMGTLAVNAKSVQLDSI